jgi:hypothetical protein
MTWLYVSVVVRICAWPSTSMTARGCTPSDSSSVAAVCRPSWSRTWRTPRLGQERLPRLPVGFPFYRPPVGLREDEVVVLPEGTGGDALLELGGSVGPQGVDKLVGQRQGAAASLGFGLLVDQALPGDPVQAPHGEGSVDQVDVRPSQAQGFRLT